MLAGGERVRVGAVFPSHSKEVNESEGGAQCGRFINSGGELSDHPVNG